MKWLEIIELRTGSYDRQALEKDLKSLWVDLKRDPDHPKFKIYENRNIGSDLSIHLFHSTEVPGQHQSPLGCQIATILKTFGLVSHTTWMERKEMLLQAQHEQRDKHNNSKENE